MAAPPVGITIGGLNVKTVLFACSGESPNVTGLTCALVKVAAPTVAVMTASENTSALSKTTVI